MNVTASATAGQSTAPILGVGPGSAITITPASGASAYAEYLLTSGNGDDEITNALATWTKWPLGTVAAATTDYASRPMAVRLVGVSGASTIQVSDAPSAGNLSQTAWYTEGYAAHRVASAATNGGQNYATNTDVNYIDPTTHSSSIFGGGENATGANIGPNQIGKAFGGETGAYTAGAASYSTILGGYDNYCNAIGSVVIGDHHRIHTSADHASTIGGSANEVKGGSYNSIVGGGGLTQGNQISSTGTNRVIVGGLNNVLSGSGNGTAVIGGNGNTDSGTGSYNLISGQSNALSGSAQLNLVAGTTHTVTKSSGLTFGNSCKPISSGAITFSGKQLAAVGDSQAISVPFSLVTTDASIQTLTITSGGDNITFDGTKKSFVIGRIFVGCLIPGTVLSSGYQSDFVATWDGATLVLSNSLGTVSGAAVTMNLVQINNNAAIVTVPLLAGSTGVLRARVTGLAATTINWWGRMDLMMGYV